MVRTYRYRLTPTRAQDATLRSWLEALRRLYNGALQERRSRWEPIRKRDGWNDNAKRPEVKHREQEHSLAEIRRALPEYAAVPLAACRGTLRTLDKAYQAFFRRGQAGKKPGHPRFKGKGRVRTIAIDDLGGRTPLRKDGKHIGVPLLEHDLKIKLHRPLLGTPKAMRLTLDGDGHWYVSLACVDVPPSPLPKIERDVGLDPGLESLVTTSDGEKIANVRPLASLQHRVRKAQRRVARRVKGSSRRRKAVLLLAKLHAHVANVRRQHAIGTANTIVRAYDRICLEDTNLAGLCRGRLAKSFHDAAWGLFGHWLACKAESADRELIRVDARGTSQECSGCGTIVPKTLSERVHRCPHCGLVMDRDHNSARVIQTRGRRVRREVSDRRPSTTREVSN